MIIPLDILSDSINSTIAGVPTIIIAAIPFIIGLIVGILLRKILKWAIIIGIIVIIIAFFGFFGLNLSALATTVVKYVPIIYAYGVLLFGVLPFGLGFIIGLIIGFLL